MKRVNPSRRQSNTKRIHTRYRYVKYVKQIMIELKGEVDKSTIIVTDFHQPSTNNRQRN